MQNYIQIPIFALILLLLEIPIATATDISKIQLPLGFKIEIFADIQTKHGEYLDGVRFMAFDANNNLYVTSAKGNKVLMLPDINKDGVADDVILVADQLNAPQGLIFVGSNLLIANQDGVVMFKRSSDPLNNGGWSAKTTTLIKDLPSGGHALKNIKLGPDGYLYLNIGSSCNVCVESDPTRATILRYTMEGSPAGALLTLGRHQQSAVWASGLRNSQGFAWQPDTDAMYATNDGADMRSDFKNGKVNDELPPEHLNKIEAGKNYGWPHCWGDGVGDPNYPAEVGYCKTTQAPEITFTSHSTPIGITFLNNTNWPKTFRQDAIVALHGSWNRKQPSGYKLVRVKFKDNKAIGVEDFAKGWLADGEASGRPVDVIVGTDGALYVSDDKAGMIYRITYTLGKNSITN